MTGPDFSPPEAGDDFDAATRALLDAYAVPPPAPGWADRVVRAAEAEASRPLTPLPRLRSTGGRARFGLKLAAAVFAGGLVTAAAAERGAFGPAVQSQVQAAVNTALGRPERKPVPKPAPRPAAPAIKPQPAAPIPPERPGPERIAPVIEKLKANPATAAKVDRFLARRAAGQAARGEAPSPSDIQELARRYRQLPPERKRALRQQLRSLPPEQQAEIRQIIRDFRASRRAGTGDAGTGAQVDTVDTVQSKIKSP